MKQLDASEKGINQLAWASDSKWIAYVRGDSEVCISNVDTGEIRIIGNGHSPGFAANNAVVYESGDQIQVADGTGTRVLVSLEDVNKNSPKKYPVVSPDGKHVVFVVNNVFHKDSQNKNAYPWRHFTGLTSVDGSLRPVMLNSQWYGGTAFWFPDSSHFGHFEYDSTGGARIHVMDLKGHVVCTMSGLHPSVSPDGRRIACKPRNGQNIVVYTAKGDFFAHDSLETVVFKIPESTGRLSGTPPQWVDNRLVIVDEGGKVFRVDTRKEDAVELKKIPVPALRGTATMSISPNRELIAVEVETDGGFALRVLSVQ
jgi:Tol biopolymer transport system component